MNNKNIAGHISAFITILIWGTTFISTKILLLDFGAVEILFFRFIIGFVVLLIVFPHRFKWTNKKQEFIFAIAGLCGICMYYLIENIALTYTQASNVGIIISVAPFFTAILSQILMKNEEPLKINFFIGFIVAIVGICLISFKGSDLQFNIWGDFLSIIAAFVWSCYSILTRKISKYNYNIIQTTRRIFAYGILFMIPALFIFDFKLDLTRFNNFIYLFNIIFLGLGASALCFVTWNFAVKILGAVKTSVYIYIVPVVTLITSIIVLHEEITIIEIIGTTFTLVGLLISQSKFKTQKDKESFNQSIKNN